MFENVEQLPESRALYDVSAYPQKCKFLQRASHEASACIGFLNHTASDTMSGGFNFISY